MLIELDIVIVNWNAGQLLRECLQSIVSANKEGFSIGGVYVVDNASTDDSLASLDSIALPVTLIKNETNAGFAAACNQGARLGSSAFILFLNPDTRLFENSLSLPIGFMAHEQNNNTAICGIQLINAQGLVSRSCAYFPSLSRFAAHSLGLDKLPHLKGTGVPMNDWDHSYDRVVDQVIGAFFLVRRPIFEQLQGFDERFFVYFEEVDFSRRAYKQGWRTMYLAGAMAFHEGGGSSKNVKDVRLYYSLRSRLLYAFKHFSRRHAWVIFFLTVLLEPVSRTFFLLVKGQSGDVANAWRAYGMLYAAMDQIIPLFEKKS